MRRKRRRRKRRRRRSRKRKNRRDTSRGGGERVATLTIIVIVIDLIFPSIHQSDDLSREIALSSVRPTDVVRMPAYLRTRPILEDKI